MMNSFIVGSMFLCFTHILKNFVVLKDHYWILVIDLKHYKTVQEYVKQSFINEIVHRNSLHLILSVKIWIENITRWIK